MVTLTQKRFCGNMVMDGHICLYRETMHLQCFMHATMPLQGWES